MHICYLNNFLTLRGGSERVMFEEAAAMRDRGHAVSFFSRHGPKDIEHAHESYYLPRVDIDKLGLAAKFRHAPRVIYNPAMGRAFRAFLNDVRPQALHAHNIYGGLTTAVLDVAREQGLPVALSVHDYKLVCPSYLAIAKGRVCTRCRGGRFYRCLASRCHKSSYIASAIYMLEAYLTTWGRKYDTVRRFICPSRFMLQTLLDNGFAAERLLYLPSPLDVSSIAPSPGRGAYALYAGRLSPEKGLPTLIEAMRELDIPLRIVGDGPLRNPLEDRIARLGLQDRITFVGYKAKEELRREFENAAFLVMPSEWFENASMSMLEAFAHGKPVIGADIGGIPEMVVPGKTGLLFPPGDAGALRAALRALWDNTSSWGDLGRAARRYVEEIHAPDRHAHELFRLYEQLVG